MREATAGCESQRRCPGTGVQSVPRAAGEWESRKYGDSRDGTDPTLPARAAG